MAKECAVRHNPVAMSGRNPIIHSFWLGGHQGVDDRADVKRPIRYTRYLSDIKPFSGFSHATAAGLPCEHLDVQGDGSHFDAVIVSAAFEGKRPIARHQLVYAALGDRMKAEIHALSMRTLTPSEYAKAGG